MPKPAQQLSNVADVKDLLKRASNIEDQFDSLREEKKDLNAEIKASGLDAKAFRTALRQYRTPLDIEFTSKVNSYLKEAEQGELFA